MRENTRIGLALVLMIVCVLVLAATRGVTSSAWILLLDVPLVCGILACFVFLVVVARRAIMKVGQG